MSGAPTSRATFWGGGLALWVAGAAHNLAFAPWGWWALQWPLLALLAAVVLRATPKRAAWWGWCFGVGWLSAGLWWLHISMHEFGGMPSALSITAVLLLAAALSLYLALAMAAVARWRSSSPVSDALLFAGAWLAAELARAQWFTGFPWIASGYVHTDGPLAGWAPWVGVYAMGALAALSAASLAQLLRHRSAGVLAGFALPLLLAAVPRWAGVAEFTSSSGEMSVSLLQPNVPQNLKFDRDRLAGNMQALAEQVQAARGQLVVTPESVLPVPRDLLDPSYWAELTAPIRRSEGRGALIGTFLGNDESGWVNSMVGISPGSGEDYAYGKRHLLPFGEFVPPGFRWFVNLMRIPLGDQASGQQEAAFAVAGQRVRPLICYEDLFGEDFAASVLGPDAATVFANATNLAWFGRHMVQEQHQQFSRMRALEFQRPFIRATNTGATGVINHRGEVTASLPAWSTGILEAQVEGRLGETPYARWVAHAGLWPLWALVLLLMLPAWIGRRRSR